MFNLNFARGAKHSRFNFASKLISRRRYFSAQYRSFFYHHADRSFTRDLRDVSSEGKRKGEEKRMGERACGTVCFYWRGSP